MSWRQCFAIQDKFMEYSFHTDGAGGTRARVNQIHGPRPRHSFLNPPPPPVPYLAHGHDFYGEGVFEVVRVVVRVVRHELLVVAEANGHHGLQEVNELERLPAVAEVEVNALVDVLDADAVLVDAVLQDELLQEQEGALVVDVLPDLGAGRQRGEGVSQAGITDGRRSEKVGNDEVYDVSKKIKRGCQ